MALPAKLKNLNVFLNGVSYLGETTSFTPPKLTRKTEAYRGGGMNGEIEQAMGLEPLVSEWAVGGVIAAILRSFGVTNVAGLLLRFAGAYQDAETETVKAVEIVIRGYHKEVDWGDGKPGENTEHKVSTAVSYLKISIDGRVEVEIDVINGVEIIDGIDRMAEIRAAIGA